MKHRAATNRSRAEWLKQRRSSYSDQFKCLAQNLCFKVIRFKLSIINVILCPVVASSTVDQEILGSIPSEKVF